MTIGYFVVMGKSYDIIGIDKYEVNEEKSIILEEA